MSTPADDTNAWNRGIIEEFRANGGKVGGNFEGTSLLLLHTIGAKSGAERINPLAYQGLDDGNVAVFASKAGAPSNPDWFYNVMANPDVSVEIGSETRRYTARRATGEERSVIWERQKQLAPGFADYEAKTDREIPVVILESATGSG